MKEMKIFICLLLAFFFGINPYTSADDLEVFKENYKKNQSLVPEEQSKNLTKIVNAYEKDNFGFQNGVPSWKMSDSDFESHTKFWEGIYKLAILYGYENSYPEAHSILDSYTGKKDIYNQILTLVNWYFNEYKNGVEQIYHLTYTYHSTGIIPYMDYTIALLENDFQIDKSMIAQRVYQLMLNYGDFELDSGSQTKGANWTFRVVNHCFRHVYISNDPARMDRLFKAIKRSLTYTLVEETGESDGFYPDRMYFHHGEMCYFTMYGLDALTKYNEMMKMLQNTRWQFSKEELNLLADLYMDGAIYSMYRGNPEYSSGPKRASQLLDRIEWAIPSCKDAIKELVEMKGDQLDRKDEILRWVENCDVTPMYTDGDENYKEIDAHRYFWTGEYQVHRRNSYYLACRRNSFRVRPPEDSGTNDAKLHLFYGCGYTPILVRGDEYRIARLGWNWLALPGTTAEQCGTTQSGKAGSTVRSRNAFSGGLGQGLYGVGGFKFDMGKLNESKTKWEFINGATAYKSNFFFDEGMLCLGSQVKRSYTSNEKAEIHTTIDQKRSETDVFYAFDNGNENQVPFTNDTHIDLNVTDKAWVWHSGVGYIVYAVNGKPVNLKITNELRELNPLLKTEKTYMQGLTKSEKALQKIWIWELAINHGVDPISDFYEYIVLPNITKEELIAYSNNPQFEIAALTDNQHVVYHKKAQMYQAVFYEATNLKLNQGGELNVPEPMILQIKKSDDEKTIFSAQNPLSYSPKLSLLADFVAPNGYVGVKYEKQLLVSYKNLKGIKDRTVSVLFDNRRNYEGKPFVDELTEDVNVNGINYSIENGSATVIQNTGLVGKITIPSSITISSGETYNVTKIGFKAFYECENITSFVLPNSITEIGSYSFYSCSALETINFPTSLTSIGEWAFNRCDKLTTITLPSSLKTLEVNTFNSCQGLKNVHVHNSIPLSISSSIFNNVPLERVILYVPRGAYNSYSEAYVWKGFGSIMEEDVVASVLTPISKAVSVYTQNSEIIVEGAELGSVISVYSTIGISSVNILVTENIVSFPLAKGIYVVKIGQKSVKVVL